MITIKVKESDIDFAKKQIAAFEKSKGGQWRYKDVEAWRGVVCEMLVSEWLEANFDVKQNAKGLDTSGLEDECDLIIGNKKVEVKSATKNYFKYLMPKIHDVHNKPKDIYIGAKYNETIEPNEIQILGYIKREDMLKYPKSRNKGAPYYEIPIADLMEITKEIFE